LLGLGNQECLPYRSVRQQDQTNTEGFEAFSLCPGFIGKTVYGLAFWPSCWNTGFLSWACFGHRNFRPKRELKEAEKKILSKIWIIC
jgi:hypothetical protein